jgi:hypothetical protein
MTEKEHYHSLPSEEWKSFQSTFEHYKREVVRLKAIKEPKLAVTFSVRDQSSALLVRGYDPFWYDRRNRDRVYQLDHILEGDPQITEDMKEVVKALERELAPFIEKNALFRGKFEQLINEVDKKTNELRMAEKRCADLFLEANKNREEVWNAPDLPNWKKVLINWGFLSVTQEYDKIRRISDHKEKNS